MRILPIIAMAFAIFVTGPALAQVRDSTGAPGKAVSYGDTVYSSTWNRIAGKPATATRWPTWAEVSGKPATFPTRWDQIQGVPPLVRGGTASLDSRYAQKSDLPNGNSCSDGYYMKGIKANGSLNCAKLPRASGGGGGIKCGAGFSPQRDAAGNVIACHQRGP